VNNEEKQRTMTTAAITLEDVHRGNPFADHPQLRSIFDAKRTQHVEADTLADLALGVALDPHRNQVYVARDATGHVVGITGFFQPAAEPTTDRETIALRWHGVVPLYRGRGYSGVMFERVCWLAAYFMPEARSFTELVPLADSAKGDRIIRHFEKLGFRCEGDPQDAMVFPAGASLPADSGLWQTMRREIIRVDGPAYYGLTELGIAAIR
jgi:GNAT superfamily N-acetyltransferase